MTCQTCGAPNPVVHLSTIVDGVQETRHFCIDCFATSEFAQPEVLSHAKTADAAQLKTDFEKNLRQLQTAQADKFDALLKSNPRFTREACTLLYQALHSALLKESRGTHHVSARKLVASCEACAQAMYGVDARATLARWGLISAEATGDLVFLHVEHGLLGRNEGDRREDFDGVPFFNSSAPG